MGIKERHERDREAVRRAILDAARDLFVTEGYRNVSIRKVAERIEYSPAAIYSYFGSKDDIFFELAEEGFRILSDPERGPALRVDLPPLDRLRAMFWRVYEFSRDYPQYFALMFVDRDVPRITREYERFSFMRNLKTVVAEQIQACIDAGVFPPTVRPMAAMRVLTMGLLGVAVMRLADRLSPAENPDDLAHDVLDAAIVGLKSGMPLRSSGPPIHCPEEIQTPAPEMSASSARDEK